LVENALMRLPRIRFLLADDPGAGNTIMAGLLIKELKIRGLIQRILILTPANLTFQWQRELKDKFRENFEVIRSDVLRANYGSNPWQDKNQVVTSPCAEPPPLVFGWPDEDARRPLPQFGRSIGLLPKAHGILSAPMRSFGSLNCRLRRRRAKYRVRLTNHIWSATPDITQLGWMSEAKKIKRDSGSGRPGSNCPGRLWIGGSCESVNFRSDCRRLSIPVRDYLASVLSRLANVPFNRIAELTPIAWAARS
jgi:hypothetical protein